MTQPRIPIYRYPRRSSIKPYLLAAAVGLAAGLAGLAFAVLRRH